MARIRQKHRCVLRLFHLDVLLALRFHYKHLTPRVLNDVRPLLTDHSIDLLSIYAK